MNCNLWREHQVKAVVSYVSIPNRDFDELQWREPESQAIFRFQGAVARF